jgi:hypothetical protein
MNNPSWNYHLLRCMEPLEDFWEIRVLGDNPELLISKNPG